MKKIRLRKWFKYYLMTINCFLIMILAGDSENFLLFTLKNIIGISLFIFNHCLLAKYSDLFKEN